MARGVAVYGLFVCFLGVNFDAFHFEIVKSLKILLYSCIPLESLDYTIFTLFSCINKTFSQN